MLGPDRFVREIEIAAGLTHPHILPLHNSGEADAFSVPLAIVAIAVLTLASGDCGRHSHARAPASSVK
jgi:hypothetical protein